MKQIVLDVSNGETKVIEVPEPSLRPGGIIVKNTFSVISIGTCLLYTSDAADE